MRRIGVLMNTAASKDQQANVATFVQVLKQLGWIEGRNLQIDIRWAGGDPAEIRTHAEDLVARGPDVILVTGNAGMPPLLRATRTIPIIFNNVADPVGAGYVDTMARPFIVSEVPFSPGTGVHYIAYCKRRRSFWASSGNGGDLGIAGEAA
jgi:putative ABC transport system substrate-binding protein